MVLDVVPEQVLEFRGEGVVWLYLDITQLLAKGNAAGAKIMLVRKYVNLPHECAGIETERIITLFELVQFLYDRNGDYYVIVLELLDGIVVVQNDVCV